MKHAKRALYFVLITAILIFIVSCNSNENSEKNIDDYNIVQPSRIVKKELKEGMVKYKIELNIPDKKDAGLFEKIVSGAIESLVDRFDPGLSIRFKDQKAILFLKNINRIRNNIQIDSLQENLKIFDLNTNKEISLETDGVDKLAKIKDLRNDKYIISTLDDTLSILGYLCNHALLIDKFDKDTMSIWYSSKINIPLSPFEYTGLNGLALELSISGFKVRASEIVNISQPDSLFNIPKGYIENVD